MKEKQSQNRSKVFLLFAFCFLLGAFPISSYGQGTPSPKAEMQYILDKLVAIVTEHSEEGESKVRQDKMRAVIEPRFDFEEMSKRSLGVKWKSISDAERTEFVDLFSELLARTYLSRIEKVKKDMVEIKNETIRQPRALVKTIVTYEGDSFPLDYKLLYRDGVWRVYDVIIENIGLISNYRSEFAGVIRKDKFSGLLQKLREKNAAKEKAA